MLPPALPPLTRLEELVLDNVPFDPTTPSLDVQVEPVRRWLRSEVDRRLREVARKERVDECVGAPLPEDQVRAQAPFTPEADALQHALRCDVLRVDERLDTRKPRFRQRPARQERDRMRGKAAAASPLDHPVPDINGSRLPTEEQDNRSERIARV